MGEGGAHHRRHSHQLRLRLRPVEVYEGAAPAMHLVHHRHPRPAGHQHPHHLAARQTAGAWIGLMLAQALMESIAHLAMETASMFTCLTRVSAQHMRISVGGQSQRLTQVQEEQLCVRQEMPAALQMVMAMALIVLAQLGA